MKIHNKRERQQIAINHLIETDYKDFMNIYRKCTKKPYSFLTIDTRLPANHFLRFRKIFLRFIIKMTLIDQLKILDDRIKGTLA